MRKKSMTCSLMGRKCALLSLGVKQCNPIGFRAIARAYAMEEFSLLGPTILFRLNNSFVPSLHHDCSNRHQNVCWFCSSEARFTRLVWGTLVKTALLNWRKSFFSFQKSSHFWADFKLGKCQPETWNLRKITSNRGQAVTMEILCEGWK